MGITVDNNLIQVLDPSGLVKFDSNDKILYKKQGPITGSTSVSNSEVIIPAIPYVDPTVDILSINITITASGGNIAAHLVNLHQQIGGLVILNIIEGFTDTLSFAIKGNNLTAKTARSSVYSGVAGYAPYSTSFDYEINILSFL